MTTSEWRTPDLDTFDNEDLSFWEQRALRAQPPPKPGNWKRKLEPEPKIVTLEDVKRAASVHP